MCTNVLNWYSYENKVLFYVQPVTQRQSTNGNDAKKIAMKRRLTQQLCLVLQMIIPLCNGHRPNIQRHDLNSLQKEAHKVSETFHSQA